MHSELRKNIYYDGTILQMKLKIYILNSINTRGWKKSNTERLKIFILCRFLPFDRVERAPITAVQCGHTSQPSLPPSLTSTPGWRLIALWKFVSFMKEKLNIKKNGSTLQHVSLWRRRNTLQRERKKKINCRCKINWGLNKSAKRRSRADIHYKLTLGLRAGQAKL